MKKKLLILTVLPLTTTLMIGYVSTNKTSNNLEPIQITYDEEISIEEQTHILSKNKLEDDIEKEKQRIEQERVQAELKKQAEQKKIQEQKKAQEQKQITNQQNKPSANNSTPVDSNWFKSKWKNNVLLEGNISASVLSQFDKKLSALPPSILNSVFGRNFKIVITTKNIATNYYDSNYKGSMIGLFCSNGHIYISATSEGANRALYHEIGHFIDYNKGWLTRKDNAFKDIYYSEKNSLIVSSSSKHHKSNAQEFFAEVFQQMMINPSRCQQSAPRAYEYIKKYL